jgi:hypothetical protein
MVEENEKFHECQYYNVLDIKNGENIYCASFSVATVNNWTNLKYT